MVHHRNYTTIKDDIADEELIHQLPNGIMQRISPLQWIDKCRYLEFNNDMKGKTINYEVSSNTSKDQ